MEMEFNNGYVVTCFAKANQLLLLQLLLLLNFTKHAPVSLFLLFLIRKRIEIPPLQAIIVQFDCICVFS